MLELGNESVGQKKLFKKLLIRQGFFKNQLLVAKDFWWSKNTRNSVQVNKASRPSSNQEF